MPLAKCVRRCWDSQLTRRYWPGDQDDIASDHPLVKAGCFQFISEKEAAMGPLEDKLRAMKEEIIAQLQNKDVGEVKRGPGRPPKIE